jgi:hypothetical protein
MELTFIGRMGKHCPGQVQVGAFKNERLDDKVNSKRLRGLVLDCMMLEEI